MLRGVAWYQTKDPNKPWAQTHTYRHVRTGELVTIWRYPSRSRGNEQLHVRLALPPELRDRYQDAEDRWRNQS